LLYLDEEFFQQAAVLELASMECLIDEGMFIRWRFEFETVARGRLFLFERMYLLVFSCNPNFKIKGLTNEL